MLSLDRPAATVDTVTDQAPFLRRLASMLLFDTTAEDDLLVLAAYAAAEEAAQNERKSQAAEQAQARSSAADSDVAETNGGEEVDGGDIEADASPSLRPTIWIPRLRDVDEVPRDRLTPIHGRLIAHGLLQFQLQGREEGVVYRLTPAGRKALSQPHRDAA